jgi:nucleoid DNA-binding protein
MNRVELEAAVAERTGHPKKVVTDVVGSVLAAVTESLAKGDSVRLVGFATLAVKDRAERAGKNPKTGEAIVIPASRKVAFRAGKDLKTAVAGE